MPTERGHAKLLSHLAESMDNLQWFLITLALPILAPVALITYAHVRVGVPLKHATCEALRKGDLLLVLGFAALVVASELDEMKEFCSKINRHLPDKRVIRLLNIAGAVSCALWAMTAAPEIAPQASYPPIDDHAMNWGLTTLGVSFAAGGLAIYARLYRLRTLMRKP